MEITDTPRADIQQVRVTAAGSKALLHIGGIDYSRVVSGYTIHQPQCGGCPDCSAGPPSRRWRRAQSARLSSGCWRCLSLHRGRTFEGVLGAVEG
ncbi:hypothetical protein ACFO9E_21900 [Streptomyces maoxianensis]|uniref:Uncharacterized protein n=1 Tax=Streptomyces maoxianensis TaxID=1459942 RepID=A0ABV9G819_9ACTN